MINDVYNVVQTIANKNNYGIITPDRFNALAKNAQLKIVSELPDQLRRVKNRKSRYGCSISQSQIQDALNTFIVKMIIQREALIAPSTGFTEYFILPTDFTYAESIWYNGYTPVTQLNTRNGMNVLKNRLTSPTVQNPMYEKLEDKIFIYPESIGVDESGLTNDVTMRYRRQPKDPKWTYISVNGRQVFNGADPLFQDFEVPDSLYSELVIEILLQVGIHLREEQIERYTQQEQNDDLQKQTLN
jgi:hypothetical protein